MSPTSAALDDPNERYLGRLNHLSKDPQELDRIDIEALLDGIPDGVGPEALLTELAPALAAIAGRAPIEQDVFVATINRRFGIGKRALRSELKALASISGEHEVSGADAGLKAPLVGEVFEAGGRYCFERDDALLAVSTFTIQPRVLVNSPDGDVLIARVTTDRGRVYDDIRFPPEAWRSRLNFVRSFPTNDMQFTGNDANVQGILRLLAGHDVPRLRGTNVMGYLDTEAGPRWVAPGIVLGPDGVVEPADVVLIPNGSSFPDTVEYPVGGFDKLRELAQRVLPLLLQVNEPAVAATMVGWFFACPCKPQLIERLGHFPILCVWGTQGSGKTSLVVSIFWRLLGASKRTQPFSATGTRFTMLKLVSSTNGVPVFIDEYRPADMGSGSADHLHRLLRRVYSGEVEERGQGDQSVVKYVLQAPVCLAGETRPDDAALVDRLVSVQPSKNRLAMFPEHRAAFQALRDEPISLLAAPIVQFLLGRNVDADLAEARRVARAALGACRSIRNPA